MCVDIPLWVEGFETQLMVKIAVYCFQNIAVDDLASCENVFILTLRQKFHCLPWMCIYNPHSHGSSKHLSPRELTAFLHVSQRQAWTETPCVWCSPSLCFESLLCSRMQTASLPGEGRDFLQALFVEIQEATLRRAGSQICKLRNPPPETGPYLPRIKGLIHGRACGSEAEQFPRPRSSSSPTPYFCKAGGDPKKQHIADIF